ncbi:alpha/beta hydrolase [Actinocorallia populi]|uniref:alpha/beta hydrolase n=1 Tax=Actinocorallia populi TaxID=2079200 RepID=UPI000D08B79B|nr:alpha/beta fold hydrolase [Actinocorallia populi]
MVERERVTFASGGADCVGYLYLPGERHGPLPCVVLAHGVSGTMDRLFPQAEAFAAAGLAALVFDYGGFGESGGEPRLVLDVGLQQENLRAAVAFARADEHIDPDRILLWGNSLGGAHVITVAAGDPRVAAVVSQIPFNGFPRKVEGRSSWNTMRLMAAILWDALRGALRLRPHYIPMLGRPGEQAVVSTDESEQHIRLLAGEGGQTRWRNSIAPRGLLGMMRYRPAEDAAHLTMPLLVCIAAQDRETPEETTRELAERAPHGELRRYEGSHFAFYTDPSIREEVLADQIAFYRRGLAAV